MKDNQIKIPEFENRSCDDIHKEIEDFKINFFQKDISLEKIKNEIKKLGLGYRKENYYWFRFRNGLYRARKHEKEWVKKLFTKTGDLWYRDWSNTDKSYYKYGRLNRPGDNFMYLSISRNASLLEVRPKENDWVTVANIVPLNTNKKLNLCTVAEQYLRKAHPDLKNIINKPNKGVRRLSKDSFEKMKLIDDFLIDIFTAKVEDECDYKYKASIAVWEYLKELNTLMTNSGIVYPSIAFNYSSVNIGLFPSAVDYNCGIDLLITFRVDWVKYSLDKTMISFHPLKIGISSFLTSGNVKIDWRNPNSEELKEYSTEIEYSNFR